MNASAGAAPEPIVIAGNGRSGTNWLLTILDSSEATHCRNEPLDLPSSPIHDLPMPDASGNLDATALGAEWDRFSQWTRNRIGVRDHFVEAPKAHYWAPVQRLGLVDVLRRRRVRMVRQHLVRPSRRDEWPLPLWLGSKRRLGHARPVFKINDFAPWHDEWIVANRSVVALHIVRHPGGYLASALRRHFELMDPPQLATEKQRFVTLLEYVRRIDRAWEARLPDLDPLDAASASLWFWAAYNSMYLDIIERHENAHLVVFDDLAADPLPVARRAYEVCDLEFTPAVIDRVTEGLQRNVWGDTVRAPTDVARAWREKLSDERRAEVEEVLARFPALAALWPGS